MVVVVFVVVVVSVIVVVVSVVVVVAFDDISALYLMAEINIKRKANDKIYPS